MQKLSGITLVTAIALITSHASYADPWFTGPLLAPPAQTVARGHVNAFFMTGNASSNAIYNREWHQISQQSFTTSQIIPQFFYGLTDDVDIEYNALYVINQSGAVSYEHVGDSSIALGFQALSQQKNNALPDLRITLQEVLPSGIYDRFDPVNAGVESTGMGSYQTAVAFNFQYLSPINENHYLYSHLSVSYTYANSVNINGLSTYGGTSLTTGRIDPGNAIDIDLAGEFTLTQNWVAVMEANFLYQQESTFHGFVGTRASGDPIAPGNALISKNFRRLFPTKHNIGKPDIGSGNLDQITLAPALEYNFSSNLGVIAGIWFTVAGKNTPQFTTSLFQFTATW